MSEYIEREALLRALSKEVEYDDDGEQEINSDTVFITIEGFPAADVADVVHGRWLINSDGYYPYCSVCKEEPKNGIMTHYCPNCGCKMDKEG